MERYNFFHSFLLITLYIYGETLRSVEDHKIQIIKMENWCIISTHQNGKETKWGEKEKKLADEIGSRKFQWLNKMSKKHVSRRYTANCKNAKVKKKKKRKGEQEMILFVLSVYFVAWCVYRYSTMLPKKISTNELFIYLHKSWIGLFRLKPPPVLHCQENLFQRPKYVPMS